MAGAGRARPVDHIERRVGVTSWLAFRNASQSEVLSATGLRGTDIVEEVPEAPFQTAALPGGWTVLFASDVMFARPDRLRTLSRRHEVLGCMAEEHAMVSMSAYHVRGEPVWEVVHDPSSGSSTLLVSGSPPPEPARLRDHASRRGAGAEDGFDIPIELAEAVCGYRHDAIGSDPETLMFTVAVLEQPDRG